MREKGSQKHLFLNCFNTELFLRPCSSLEVPLKWLQLMVLQVHPV